VWITNIIITPQFAQCCAQLHPSLWAPGQIKNVLVPWIEPSVGAGMMVEGDRSKTEIRVISCLDI